MLELKNITYKVLEKEQEKIILDDVSCVFEDNCLTAITGHNGSGKSTLTKIIMGIIKPTGGQIIFNGKDITDLPINERANLGISYAFQSPIGFRGLTVKELIDIATHSENNITKACEYLSKVGICAKNYINRDFDKTLSGGEQKRIELALAIARNTQLTIFDEPEAGIDLWSFESLKKLFDREKSYIVVSHQEKLLKHADKILVLKQGKIERFGKTKQVLKSIGNLVCKKVKED